MTRLSKGQNIPLMARTVRAVIGWQSGQGVPEVDVSALLLGDNYKVRSDDDFVFYNQPAHESGAVKLTTADTVIVDTRAVPADVERVLIGASADGGPFSAVPGLHLRILDDSNGAELARFDIADASTETAFLFGEVYRRGDQWKLRAVGQGFDTGLHGLATAYGVGVEEEQEADAPAVPAAPAGEHRAQETVLAPDEVPDLGELPAPPVAGAPLPPPPPPELGDDEEGWEPPEPWDPAAGAAIWDVPQTGGGSGPAFTMPSDGPSGDSPLAPPPSPAVASSAASSASGGPDSGPAGGGGRHARREPEPAAPAAPSTPSTPAGGPSPNYTLPAVTPHPYYNPQEPDFPASAPPASAPPASGPPMSAPVSALPMSTPPAPPMAPYMPPSTPAGHPQQGGYQAGPHQQQRPPQQMPPTRTMPVQTPTGGYPPAPNPTLAMPTQTHGMPAAVPIHPAKQQQLARMEQRAGAQAPHLLAFSRRAAVALDKRGLGGQPARVALCLDISASMSGLYRSGKVQGVAERVLALALRIVDAEQVDVFLYGANAYPAGQLGLHNAGMFLSHALRQHPLEGGTMYGSAMRLVRRHFFGFEGPRQQPFGAPQPVYVVFLTDGATFDQSVAVDQLRFSGFEPVFWQFMAIGDTPRAVDARGRQRAFHAQGPRGDFSFLENLDSLSGRFIDNSGFFAVNDPANLPDDLLYDLLLTEYPRWLGRARQAGLLPPR